MANLSSHRFLLADDHPLFRDALRQVVMARYPAAAIVEAGSFEEISDQLAADGEVDLVLLDLTMPGVRGFSGLMFLRAHHPGVPVVVVSANDSATTVRHAIGFGASGFIPKSLSTEMIGRAIDEVLGGSVWVPAEIDLAAGEDDKLIARLASLTPQQFRVLMMLASGLLNKQIAYELGVSEATVKAHVSAILQKLQVDSRTQAVIAAAKVDLGDRSVAFP